MNRMLLLLVLPIIVLEVLYSEVRRAVYNFAFRQQLREQFKVWCTWWRVN